MARSKGDDSAEVFDFLVALFLIAGAAIAVGGNLYYAKDTVSVQNDDAVNVQSDISSVQQSAAANVQQGKGSSSAESSAAIEKISSEILISTGENETAVVQTGMQAVALFCESPGVQTISTEKIPYTSVSCDEWHDVSSALAKLDGNYVILKRGNALVYYPSGTAETAEMIRILSHGFHENSCLNLQPDYRGDLKYPAVSSECSGSATFIDYQFEFVHTNPEIEEFFGYDSHTLVKSLYLSTYDVLAVDGIFDAPIPRVREGAEQKFPLKADIPLMAEEFGGKISEITFRVPNERICEGCIAEENICVASGQEWQEQYCGTDRLLKDKKEKGELCTGVYECMSGICTKGKCVSPPSDIFKDIGEWFDSMKK